MSAVGEVVTWEFLVTLVTLGGAVAAVWWRIESRIELAKRETLNAVALATGQAALALQQVADLRVHVAETYASKGGVREMSDRISAGQDRIFDEMKRLQERMDRIIEERRVP